MKAYCWTRPRAAQTVLALVLCWSAASAAQQSPAQSATRNVTAGERTGLLKLFQMDADPLLIDTVDGKPHRVEPQKVREMLKTRAQQWAAGLAPGSITGIQLDAAGALYVAAGKDAEAREAIDRRLATPGLTVADRAYTLESAIKLFAEPNNPARMPVALAYMRQLETMPVSVNVEKFLGYMTLAYAYYNVGDGQSTVANVLRAFPLVPAIPFAGRMWVFQSGDGRDIGKGLSMLSEVWSVDTTHRAALDSIGKVMLSYAKASPEQLANDTRYKLYASYTGYWTQALQDVLTQNAMVGQPAPATIATHWYNGAAPPVASDAAAPGAKQFSLADGKIRLFEFGGLGCSACLTALPVMQRIREKFAGTVDVWYMSTSAQRWGATDCTPDESAEHIRKYYVVHHKSQVPMGVWAPPVDDSTREPGAVLAREHPTFKSYKIEGVPVFVVVDGKGRVRRIIKTAGPDFERSVSAFLTYLVAEAKREEPKRPDAETSRVVTPSASSR